MQLKAGGGREVRERSQGAPLLTIIVFIIIVIYPLIIMNDTYICHNLVVAILCSLQARRSSTIRKDMVKKFSAKTERLMRQETLDQEVHLA